MNAIDAVDRVRILQWPGVVARHEHRDIVGGRVVATKTIIATRAGWDRLSREWPKGTWHAETHGDHVVAVRRETLN